MADIYVDNAGANSSPFASWANAATTLAGAAGVDAAGDSIWVRSTHTESSATGQTIALAGTLASPVKVICGTNAASPPTTYATTGSVATTGNNNITFTGVSYIVGGLIISVGDSTLGPSLLTANTGGAYAKFIDCKLRVAGSGSGGRVQITNTGGVRMYWENVTVRFAAAGQGINTGAGVFWEWNGGGIESGGTAPTTLFLDASSNSSSTIRWSGLDLSNGGSTMNLFASTTAHTYNAIIRDSKLPGSWSGSLVTGTIASGSRFEMHNCDSGTKNYRIAVTDYTGSLIEETTIVRTSGASDGTTSLSWKVTTTANAEWPHLVFYTPEIHAWNDTTGSSKTATIEFVHDSLTALKDNEIWVEVLYLSSTTQPLGTWIKNDVETNNSGNLLGTAASQTSSSATWTTTGITNVNKQKLSVTFTPQMKGYVVARVGVTKASYTVYIDPVLTIA